MNIELIDRPDLVRLAGMHRSYFVTGLLSERLAQVGLYEVVLYAYGIHAGSDDEAEEFKHGREARRHEGHLDCARRARTSGAESARRGGSRSGCR